MKDKLAYSLTKESIQSLARKNAMHYTQMAIQDALSKFKSQIKYTQSSEKKSKEDNESIK